MEDDQAEPVAPDSPPPRPPPPHPPAPTLGEVHDDVPSEDEVWLDDAWLEHELGYILDHPADEEEEIKLDEIITSVMGPATEEGAEGVVVAAPAPTGSVIDPDSDVPDVEAIHVEAALAHELGIA